ncbi:hypothetical protein [Actinoplanes couchii]|uniref:Uncharacterized protein n=1 Tax=Actinoplanes couchii TaxID=403638 RepID=A0ABQ3XKE5_9ACTN|nr:hypothetical protein [Actinoplanes couchii]MDR6320566.1 hypothetical protein [Actinoplanes couchii]GID58969.1 hypothetical protein Aco03nite_073730 [Actinoplanes couchii]
MPPPPQWRLFDSETGVPLTDCQDIDGLFDDRPFPADPVYERVTLRGCAPAGPLKAAVDGTGPAWLGTVDAGLELQDACVIGHRRSTDGLLDIDLLAHRQSAEGGTTDTSRLTVWWPWEQPAGTFRTAEGLARYAPGDCPPGPPVILLGCRPAPALESGRAFDADLAHLRTDGTVLDDILNTLTTDGVYVELR